MVVSFDWLIGWIGRLADWFLEKRMVMVMVIVEFGDGRFVCGDFLIFEDWRKTGRKKRTGDGSSDEDLDRGLPQKPKPTRLSLIPFP